MLLEIGFSIFALWFLFYYAIWGQRKRIKQKYIILRNTEKDNDFRKRLYAAYFLFCIAFMSILGLMYCHRLLIIVMKIT